MKGEYDALVRAGQQKGYAETQQVAQQAAAGAQQ